MRLSQLARKLEISPSVLMHFYDQNKIRKYASLNTKVDEEDIILAIQHFQDGSMKGSVDETKAGKTERKSMPEEIDDNIEATNEDNKADLDSASPIGQTDQDFEEVEMISMPKIKLEGVKVVGKIELPEPKEKSVKKETSKSEDNGDDATISSTPKPARLPGKRSDKRESFKNKGHRKIRKDLSYEEKLKREEQKRLEKRDKEKQLNKEKKKQRYLKNVKPPVTTSSKKKSNSKKHTIDPKPVKKRPEYKNPLRKFWAWLNGEYDH